MASSSFARAIFCRSRNSRLARSDMLSGASTPRAGIPSTRNQNAVLGGARLQSTLSSVLEGLSPVRLLWLVRYFIDERDWFSNVVDHIMALDLLD